ncbi:MAG: glycosyltransferase family 2 protein [Bacteroidota bacterium]
MAVKNGASYIDAQVDSILSQLNHSDELIVSDDHSTDATLDIVRAFKDQRIKICSSPRHGATQNFEFALSRSSGEFIFLADQDDVWHPHKISTMRKYLNDFELVICNCSLVDEKLQPIIGSFFESNGSGPGFLKNLLSNSYMGCCMAFRKSVMQKALPFPADTAHDHWIGMVAELHFKTFFLEESLVMHRRHGSNASTSGEASTVPHIKRVSQRYQLVRNLISRSL